MNVHIITGPNGMCRCGEDGKTCSEILESVVPKDLGSYLAGYKAALQNQGAVDNSTQQARGASLCDDCVCEGCDSRGDAVDCSGKITE